MTTFYAWARTFFDIELNLNLVELEIVDSLPTRDDLRTINQGKQL